MVFLLIVGLLSLANKLTKCEFFAEEINELTYLANNVTVIHTCTVNQLVCLQISVQYYSNGISSFQMPTCNHCTLKDYQKKAGKIEKTVLPLYMSDELTCSPSYWNSDPLFVKSARLHLFIISKTVFDDILNMKWSEIRNYATKKMNYELFVPDPYSRKNCLTFRSSSASFYHNVMYFSFTSLYSSLVEVPIPLADGLFPSNSKMGLYLNIPTKWNNHYFAHFIQKNSNKFTCSFWIYLSSPCAYSFCSILSFFNDENEQFSSPTILLSKSGFMHFQAKLKYSNVDTAFQVNSKLPLRSWSHIVFSIDSYKWSLTLISINGETLGDSTTTKFFDEVQLNITQDVGIFGGSQVYAGIHGFLSDIFLYPGVFGRHKEIHDSKRTFNFDLRISHEHRVEDCSRLINELEFYMVLMHSRLMKQINKETCTRKQVYQKKESKNMCFTRVHDLKRPKIYQFMKGVILQNLHDLKMIKIWRNMNLTKTLLGDSTLFADVLTSIKEHISLKVLESFKRKGIKLNSVMASYLKDSACLGDSDARYILATSYYYGIGEIKINTKKALELLLINVDEHVHRLSILALGNIHYMQLIPGLPSIASVFYKAVADYTPSDIENIENKDMFNDNIRLINEAHIREHTDEDGDLFQWIKHQATAGIPWAKQRLGRMLYWGSQGVRRNLNMAVNFFKMAAEDPDAEPGDHFDYGLLLVKNPNKPEDFDKGKMELKKASESDPRALTVLGWLAETHEKNISKAFEYYQKADKMGNADAAFNLGIYYHYGKEEIIKRNKKAAFKYFEKAAIRNQLNAGAMYSHYILSGIAGFLFQNATIATNWARYVAEQTPKIGYFLSEGVRAYRKKQIELSVLYYLLAAFSGIELGNFNIAILCDEHEVLVNTYLQRECTWYHYNLTTQREEHQIHAFSLIKMGDKNWYGCLNGERNINKSIEFYLRASEKKEPQAYFNLAFILENEDIFIHRALKTKLFQLCHIPQKEEAEWRHDVIIKLYKRCEEFSENDSYLPCRLAIQRLWITNIWKMVKIKIQIGVTVIMSFVVLYKFIHLWKNRQDMTNDGRYLSNI